MIEDKLWIRQYLFQKIWEFCHPTVSTVEQPNWDGKKIANILVQSGWKEVRVAAWEKFQNIPV